MELTPADFVLYIVGGTFIVVAIVALGSRMLHHRVEKRAQAHRVICRLCLNAFEHPHSTKTVPCPACGALNEKGRSRRLG